jgi:hypothetical protein
MKIVSELRDERINSVNVLVELTVKEYEELIQDRLNKNDFQRKRVRSSKTVYSLLKKDLMEGCVIPPIVLALVEQVGNIEDLNFDKLKNVKEHLIILDGLQRTNTIFDLLTELRTQNDNQKLQRVENLKLRVEIYIGLNRIGILYRMLTLNTGQTPMSLRQQVEMLYMSYIDVNINGIVLVRATDTAKTKTSKGNKYNFKDIIEGFNAYLSRDELPIDKEDVLENIQSLEKLSNENQSKNLFESYLTAINLLVIKIKDLFGNIELSESYLKEKPTPFAKDAVQMFKKQQAISGFGAAVGKLIDFEIISNIDDTREIIEKIHVTNPEDFLEEINDVFLWLKNDSKKIGNAQRSFFAFFFRFLLNKDSDGYTNLNKCMELAFRRYKSENM